MSDGERERCRRRVGALNVGLAMLVAGIGGGCTQVMYDGPRRPRLQVARIEPYQISLESVDGREASSSELELLPGNHRIRYRLNAVKNYILVKERFTSGPVSACIQLKAGRRYVLYAVDKDDTWELMLHDKALNRSVLAGCSPDEDEN